MLLTGLFVLICAELVAAGRQPDLGKFTTLPEADEYDCICKRGVQMCNCTFVVEHRLTMLVEKNNKTRLVYPDKGYLKIVKNKNDPQTFNDPLSLKEGERVITADGERSRLVIAINGKFPGPRIEVYENQILNLEVHNKFHTDSISIHFHGLHQKETPWMDGVAFITQCPILPGQIFNYRFTAYPAGTSMYHAHIGDQRSMGLYGPLIVRPVEEDKSGQFEIIMTLQDWNHVMDAETAYQTMLTGQFNYNTDPATVLETTYSHDGANFSRFEFHSGLVNGKGRYWTTRTEHNNAPLANFDISVSARSKVRVIGAMTLYPMRVFINGIDLTLHASDGFEIRDRVVSSIVVQPGERYDFTFTAPSTKTQLLIIAETLESPSSLGDKYHAAEAILNILDGSENGDPNQIPANDKTWTCPNSKNCVIFNCPFGTYMNNTPCISFNNVSNFYKNRNPMEVKKAVQQEYFFNFAFPGPLGNTPGSVNGREFVSPTSSLLTQPNTLTSACQKDDCQNGTICSCTYIQTIAGDQLIQMTFINLGNGSGWSHPVHLHGHSFYVMKMGFGTYNDDGKLVEETQDIKCSNIYCTEAEWSNSSWKGGNIPELNIDPPQKDTIIVPTGGYVVIRFISDNPGMWFLHCHIDLHNTNGMGMIISESPNKIPKTPGGFPQCGNFLYNGLNTDGSKPVTCSSPSNVIASALPVICYLVAHVSKHLLGFV